MAGDSVAVEVRGVTKRFRLYHERNQSLKAALMRGRRAAYDDFLALDDVSFDIPTGSTFGLIGTNGSGKSTLLKCLAKILRPDKGRIATHGSLAALLELGSGFHPELSGRENVYLNGSILGMSKNDIDANFDNIVDFAGIGQFIDQPVKNYSSGMYVRLGFSVAINVEPEILLVDEVLAVGDAAFQQKCMDKFSEFRAQGRTVVLVSHAMGSMRSLCDHVAWLDHGKVLQAGPARDVVDSYVDAQYSDRPLTEPGTAPRTGTGEVRITSVELLDESGRPLARQARTGDRVVMRVHYEADKLVPNVLYGLGLQTREGADVWSYNTRDQGMVIDQEPGVGYIDCAVPALMLHPGPYQLLASVLEASSLHVYDFLRPAIKFEVAEGHPRESGGPLALGTSWSAPIPV